MNWNITFMDIAESFAKHSHCVRLHVGAIIVKDKRVISCGYNGTPTGMENCDKHFEEFDINSDHVREMHHEFSRKYEIHAEQNAISYAAKNGVSIDGCTMYITASPCRDCAKLIAAAGIKKVIYRDEYKRDTEGIDFLQKAGIKITKLEDSNEN